MTILSILVKVSVVLVTALGVTWALRRRSASARALVLSASLLTALIMPVLALVTPALSVTVPDLNGNAAATAGPEDVPTLEVLRPATGAGLVLAAVGLTETRTNLLGGLWLAGLALTLIPIGLSLMMGKRHRAGASELKQAGVETLSLPARDAWIQHGIDVRVSADIGVPMAVGLRRPVVLLPLAAATWSGDQIERAIAHETEHIRRGDLFMLPLARMAVALHWFNPLVWIVWRRFRLDMERACDDAAVERGGHVAYAEQLVTLARQVGVRSAATSLAMATATDLSTRVRSVLDRDRVRGRVAAKTMRRVLLAVCLASAAVAPLQVASAQGGADPELVPRPAPIPGGGTIMGIVRDPTGAPLGGLLLIVERNCFGPGLKDCDYGSWTRADRFGGYKFEGLPAGSFHITSPIDFFPGIQFDITMGATLERDLSMEIESLNSEFTICATCPALIVPESLAKEFEADRKDALDHPVSAPIPVNGWEFYRPGQGSYPAVLQAAGISGTVVVEGVIGLDGVPTSMKAEPSGPLGAAAIASLAEEVWQPGRVRGVAIEVPFRFLIRYKLD